MGFDFRMPSIVGSDKEKLEQIRSYLYQFIPQLQWALNSIETSSSQVVTPTPRSFLPAQSANLAIAINDDDPEVTFNSIKALIIKSADIVDAYYEEINKRLEGVYVAQSDFGDFAEKTSQEIENSSTSTTQRFENIQVIISNHDQDISSTKNNMSTIEGSLQVVEEDISYAKRDIVSINGAIESLDSSVAVIEGDIAYLDTSLQTAKTELSGSIDKAKSELVGDFTQDLNTAKSELSGSINSTKSELTQDINKTKTELSGSIDTAKSELTQDINTAKDELSGSIDTAKTELTQNINNAKTELSTMVSEVDSSAKEANASTNARIDDTNGSIAGLGVSLNDTNSKIADIDEDLQNAKGTFNNSIQSVQESISDANTLLENAKAQLQGSLDDLEVYVTGLQNVIIGVTAYLKSGLLYYTDAGVPVYGLEIGQTVTDEITGTEVFNKYARFTSEKLSFYDQNGLEVAYISDKKLYIRMAEITVSFKIGGLIDLVMANGDVVTKWVGG